MIHTKVYKWCIQKECITVLYFFLIVSVYNTFHTLFSNHEYNSKKKNSWSNAMLNCDDDHDNIYIVSTKTTKLFTLLITRLPTGFVSDDCVYWCGF